MRPDPTKPSISIIGAGAAGGSLAAAFFDAGRRIDFVVDPVGAKAEGIAARTHATVARELSKAIAVSDIVLVAVPDAMIGPVAESAAALDADLSHQVWLHLSGALPASILEPLGNKTAAIGAFHPAHAFPPGQITPIASCTRFGVDGNDAALCTADALAADLGGRTVLVPAESRALYHAACVLSCNAVLGLIAQAKSTLQSIGISGPDAEKMLLALAGGAIGQAAESGLAQALTGPIRRGDEAAVARHLAALKSHDDTTRLYKAASRAVLQLARTETDTPKDDLDRIFSLLVGD